MQTITLSFDRRSRALTADFDGAGTVIDDMAVVFAIAPIEGAVIEMVFGVLIRDGSRRFHPIGRFSPDGKLTLRNQVLAACTGGTLPISLKITYDDGTVIGSRQLILDVVVVPDASQEVQDTYGDLIMMRSSSWTWLPDVRYETDSFAVWDGRLWQSASDGNIGNEPSNDSEHWIQVGSVGPMGPQGPQGEQGLQGIQGEKGDPFTTYRTFSTVAEMEADLTVPDGEAAGRGMPAVALQHRVTRNERVTDVEPGRRARRTVAARKHADRDVKPFEDSCRDDAGHAGMTVGQVDDLRRSAIDHLRHRLVGGGGYGVPLGAHGGGDRVLHERDSLLQ